MRRIFLLAVIASLFLVSLNVSGVDTGGIGIGIVVPVEISDPLVWLGDGRVLIDDNVEQGRISATTCGNSTPTGVEELCERTQNYAFEGEQIYWPVLVYDANGLNDISEVIVTLDDVVGPGNPVDASCVPGRILSSGEVLASLSPAFNNVVINGNTITTVPGDGVMQLYDCLYSVEPYDPVTGGSVTGHGRYFIAVEVCDAALNCMNFDENEYWFLNPILALTIDSVIESGPVPSLIDFGTVTPGTTAYATTIAVGNGAEPLSGVLLDMFISGTDFYDPANSAAMCPTSNQLALTNFRYYAVTGAYGTASDPRADAEGYVPINYGDRITQSGEIICSDTGTGRTGSATDCDYNAVESFSLGNVLAPGADISITFRLDLPMPCNGDFSEGDILFWGEAV